MAVPRGPAVQDADEAYFAELDINSPASAVLLVQAGSLTRLQLSRPAA